MAGPVNDAATAPRQRKSLFFLSTVGEYENGVYHHFRPSRERRPKRDDSFAAELIFEIYRGELPFAGSFLRVRARKEAEFTTGLRPKSTFDQLIGRPV